MQIYKITKGNFALENTREIRPHENNLRFRIKIEDKYYEYAIDNKDCPALRTPNAEFNKVLKHKRGFLNKYAYVVKLDNLSVIRRPKKMIDKYEILLDLCEAFDNFSDSERKIGF